MLTKALTSVQEPRAGPQGRPGRFPPTVHVPQTSRSSEQPHVVTGTTSNWTTGTLRRWIVLLTTHHHMNGTWKANHQVDATHTAMLLIALVLAVVLSGLIAAAAFAVARWGQSPLPDCVTRGAKAFATTMTVCSAVAATVLSILR
ncbi:hypothetical protein [Streptomyces sp. NPDC001135]